ncbi:MAG: hypothetical protein WKF96_18085 [Solirubrobacteraceae bacterium]
MGWLSGGHPYPTGPSQVRMQCGLRPVRLRNGEIRVTGEDGTVYAAPTMIAHYVAEHDYLPPQEFVDALLPARRRAGWT